MKSIAIASLLWVLAVPAALATTDIAPDALARSVTDEVLALVRADKELKAGNQQRLVQLVESKVLPHFNFTRMTQLAVGRNWRQATPEQRNVLTEEFRALLVRTYASMFTVYRNQTVDYRPVRMGPNDSDVLVRSVIRQSGGQPIAVDYSMEKVAGAWKVYDVKVEGVSLVENYRNTFNSEIQRGGVDGLIRTLAERNKVLAAQAKRP